MAHQTVFQPRHPFAVLLLDLLDDRQVRLGDLRQLLNDCSSDLNDEQIADELNRLV